MLPPPPRSTLFPYTTLFRSNEACLQMLEEIRDVSNVPEFIRKVKYKNSGVKLMGFGHRVYKNYDPRAKLMRSEEHTSELQSQSNLVCRLLLEKKNKKNSNL